MPTREDVDLARAAIDRGFLTIKESVRCLEIQREYDKNGQQVPLERIFLETNHLTEEQVRALKESLARAAALRRIGHFEIISKVGAGGMGTVYRAKDTKADRIVALKVLSPGHARNREYIQRFLREAHASGQLSHPNIVQGYDAGEADGKYYFAMEFVEGITVGDMLKEGRPIPEQQALDIAIQVAKALEHAEENGIVHRDIKPDNIMITPDGTAKLADLGLARITTRPGTDEKKSLGTAYYASPEQCEGAQNLDTKTDMYSFGATLFHMLAGRVPFDDDTPEGIMAKHLREKPPYLKDLNVQLSHGVSKIVRKLMAKQKRDRYASMSDVVQDLTLVRMGRSPRLGEKSRYDSAEYRYRSSTGSWRTKRPSPTQKLRRIAVYVAAGLALVGATVLVYDLVRPRPPAPPRPHGAKTPPARTTAPARTADQYYLEAILKERDGLPPEQFYKKLLRVAEKYPDTPSAAKARQEAAKVLEAIEAEALPLFRDRKQKAEELRDRLRFGAALAALSDLDPRYAVTRFPAALAALRQDLRRAADRAFRKIADDARTLAREHRFDDAIAAYRPVIDTFDIPALRRKAQAAVRKLQKEKAAYEKRLAEEAARKRHRQRITRDLERIQAALDDLRDFASKVNPAQAAAELEALARKLEVPDHRAAAARLAAHFRRLRDTLGRLHKARKALRNRTLSVTLKDGTRIEGVIFGIRQVGLTIKVGASMRSVPWPQLLPADLRALAKQAAGGTLGPAERRAFAVLFHFSGRAQEARAELDRLAADPRQKAAAERLQNDLQLFLKKAD